MSTKKSVDIGNAEHYVWGKGCDGWHLLKTPELSVIMERMPPGTSEVRHFHGKARQFFFVLQGELTMEVEHQCVVLTAEQGLEILPGQAHQARNEGAKDVKMIVTSQPPSHGDRVESKPH